VSPAAFPQMNFAASRISLYH